jgi:hypothetical protein
MKFYSCLKTLFLSGVLLSSSVHAFDVVRRWESTTPGVGPSITWAFANDGANCRVNTDSLCADNGGTVSDISGSIIPGEDPGVIIGEASRAFEAWSDVANISFEFVFDQDADILIGGHPIDGRFDGGTGSTLAHTFSNVFNLGTDNEIISLVDIHFDTDDMFSLTPDSDGGFFFNFLTHEIGHALGLGHEDDFGAIMNTIVPDQPTGLQADDIAGIQEIYGAAVPLPAAVWMMFSGLGFLAAMRKHVIAS